MRLGGILGGCAAVAIGSILFTQVVVRMPFRWTHHLNATCRWDRQEWLRRAEPFVMLGGDLSRGLLPDRLTPDAAADAAEHSCLHTRGWHGGSDLRAILTKWPA